jgi:hypothetical protein
MGKELNVSTIIPSHEISNIYGIYKQIREMIESKILLYFKIFLLKELNVVSARTRTD